MEVKFNKGEWVLSETGDGYIVELGSKANRLTGCEILYMGSDLYNSQLIAAAPDMYGVICELEESAVYWSEYDVPLGIVEKLQNALAKARGEK
jgi:hypothetical protein